jgi:hypothetical protein
MAVDEAHHGIGPALVAECVNYAVKRGGRAIGALVHTNAPTSNYLQEQVSRTLSYGLYTKQLS